ncbi:MAG: MFS transporter [Rhodobacteraceae bacterium TMED111]|nr:MFS transporter [Marinovum sp.]OUV38058.1 MAG: MFS transporter [Rhodobacteraceae bacterium TMED111]
MREHDSLYSWTRLFIALLLATVGNIGMWVVVIVLPDIQQEFKIDRGTASIPFALTMVGFAIGNWVMGHVVDRYGITKTIILAATVNTAGYVAAMYVNNVYSLSILQFFIGLGTAAAFGPLIADTSHWFLKRRGIAVALIASGNYFSGAIWPPLFNSTLQSDGWRDVYWILALSTVFIMIPLSLLLAKKISEETARISDAASSDKRQNVSISPKALTVLLSIAGIGCCVAMSMPQVHIVAFCIDLGFGPAVGAEMLSLMLIGGIISRLINGLIADKLGGVYTLLIGSTLQCIALFLYLPFDGLVSLYIVSLVFGLSQGGIVPSYAIIIREYLPGADAGTRVGFVMMCTIMGMAIGGWMSGWIYDLTGSYAAAFWNGIVWNFLNIAIVLFLITRNRKSKIMRLQTAV